MESNFEFLRKWFPLLAEYGSLAEKCLYSDTNTCLLKLGLLGEFIVNEMLKLNKLNFAEDASFKEKIEILKQEDSKLLPTKIYNILTDIRIARNNVSHPPNIYKDYKHDHDVKSCEILLEKAYKLSQWFMASSNMESDSREYITKAFALPKNNQNERDCEVLLRENKELSAKLSVEKLKHKLTKMLFRKYRK